MNTTPDEYDSINLTQAISDEAAECAQEQGKTTEELDAEANDRAIDAWLAWEMENT